MSRERDNLRHDELEEILLDDPLFQHILKFAPESQRELMTFELAKYFKALIKKKVGENPYDLYDATLQHYGYKQAVADLYTALGIKGESNE